MHIKNFLIVVVCLFSQALYAQTPRIDSLEKILQANPPEEIRLKTILAICEDHQSINKDTLYNYASVALDLASKFKDPEYHTLAELAMANSYIRWGWFDSALVAIQPEIPKYPATDPSKREMYFKLGRQKALSYGMRSDFKNALFEFYALVSSAEKYKDTLALCANMNTIGSIAIARDEAHEAISWFFRALSYATPAPENIPNTAAIYVNMANAYHTLNKLDSADYYSNLSLPLARKAGNLHTLATALRVRSAILLERGKVNEAESALQEMISVRTKTNDLYSLIDENMQLVDFYITTGQYEKAIKYCKDRMITGNLYNENDGPGKTFVNNITLKVLYYEALAKAYKASGNSALYQQTLEELIAAKDSSYEASSNEAIAEIRTKYEVTKKENTIIQQKLDITRKNYVLYGSLLLSVLITIIGWMLFREYRRRQIIKMEKMQEEEKLLSVKAVRDAEEKERRRIATDLHDNLGAYAASISSNLDYIHLPEADTTNKRAIAELRLNAKSIVSQLNDTIWALNKESLSLTAISDRIKLFLQRLGASYPEINMEVKENILIDESLLPYQAFHLFQIVQEAITNCLKHSGAKRITVYIQSENGWSIQILDDGKGMNGAIKSADGGNGLPSMKNRASKSGWSIEWKPNEPRGTAVMIHSTSN
jgi:signal transduction histidine kinase